MLRNPDLTRQVHTLDLTELSWEENSDCTYHTKPDQDISEPGNEEEEEIFIAAIRHLNLTADLRERWESALRAVPQNSDAVLAVMLASLPNLTRLGIKIGWSKQKFLVQHVFELAGQQPNPPIMRQLKELMYTCEHDKYLTNSGLLLPMLQIPSLTHLLSENFGQMYPAFDDERYGGEGATPPSSSSMRHLEMRGGHIDANGFGRLLAHCGTNLCTFIYHREVHFDPDPLPASSLLAALRPFQDTLENVYLSYEADGCVDDEEEQINPLNFASFSNLKNLHISADYIVKDPERSNVYDDFDPEARITWANMPLHERLPSSIETVRIKNPGSDLQARAMVDSLRDVLSVRAEKFSNLTEIIIEAPFNRDGTKYGAEALETDAFGVSVSIRKLDTIDGQPQYTWQFGNWPAPNVMTINSPNYHIMKTDEHWGMPGMRITWCQGCNDLDTLMEL